MIIPSPNLQVRVLGPMAAEVAGRKVGLGGRLQLHVFAMLVSAGRRVVSMDRMVDDLWRGEPPPTAVETLRAYIARLRRIVEPDRVPGESARLLVTVPPGYALRLDDDAVDAWRFERLVAQARELGPSRPSKARALLYDALSLWHGTAFAEVADEPWAAAESARLEEQRLAAWELLTQMTLRTGAAAEAVPAAEALTRQDPLREESWRLLAVALWGSGRQADALATLRRSRRILADEAGLDPGPALVELEGAIRAQSVEVLARSMAGDAVAPRASAGPGLAATDEVFVGRAAEMATLRETADAVRAGGSRIVLVTGDAGAGKSSVLARLHRVLEADGWLVAAGRCPEDEGAPPAWAWVQVLRFLAGRVPPGALSGSLAPLLDEDRPAPSATDASSGRFRMRRTVCAWLASVAAAHPLAVILDDVHRADAETLALLTAAAGELAGVPVLLAATFRPTEVDDRLAEALAVLARRSPQRLPLGGLPLSDVDKIVRIVCRGSVDAATVAALAERTGGNPFYVRESARLLASEGALVAMSEIPKGVRDVLRRRLARLPASVVTVLRLVAVVGRDADVEVVVTAADIDQSDVLDALEIGVAAGLVTEPRPGMVRFVHALVRDTVYADLPHVRRGPMHARVAAAIERLKPNDLSALAHHYACAGSLETARRAVAYALRGAEVAERRYAHDAAVLLLTQALDSHERLPAGAGDRDAEWVDIAGRLLRAQVRTGAVAAARATRDRAIDVAAAAGREDLLVTAFTAWTEPTPWMTRPYRMVDERVVAVLERLLRRTDLGPADRCRLLDALVAELAGEGDPRAAHASRQAVDLARGVGDPALLALALSEEARAASWDREPDRRATLAEEISRIGTEHGLVAYDWYGEFVSATVAAARGDLPALRRRTERCLALAKAYQMAEPVTVGLCSRAMLAHVAGRFDEAERLYAGACTAMAHHGSLHAEDFGTLARITIRFSQHRMAEFAAADRALDARYGPVAVDVRAAALAAAGRHREARDLLADAPPLRPDLYFSLFATLRAMAIVAVGARGSAEELYAALLPINDQLAGAASTSLVMRPIAYTLGELARVLGRRADAADHFAHAVAVAQRWQAPHWHAEARENAAR